MMEKSEDLTKETENQIVTKKLKDVTLDELVNHYYNCFGDDCGSGDCPCPFLEKDNASCLLHDIITYVKPHLEDDVAISLEEVESR